MKKIILLAIIFSVGFVVKSQIVEKDGKYFDESGNLYSGEYEEFYDNGNLNEKREYKNGIFHGTWITWNKEGTKTAIAGYKDGKKHGEWIIWDDNGVKRYKMLYKDGQRVGTWLQWDENGVLVSQMEMNKNE